MKIQKPCHIIGYCPYGRLVEDFPLRRKPISKSCKVFGHDCPVFKMATDLAE